MVDQLQMENLKLRQKNETYDTKFELLNLEVD